MDIKSAAWFCSGNFPGAIIGAMQPSDPAPSIQHRFRRPHSSRVDLSDLSSPNRSATPEGRRSPNHTREKSSTSEGKEHVYHFLLALGSFSVCFVGFFSSLLGIGGGIIHVPVLNRTLNFPVHIATATSHAILSFVALTGTIVHLANGI